MSTAAIRDMRFRNGVVGMWVRSSSTGAGGQSVGSAPVGGSPPPSQKPTKENIYTLPNALTTTRLVLSPVIGYLIVSNQYSLALGSLILAGFSDMLDGWIARKWNMKTVLGSALDPAADKMLMTVLTVSLCSADLLPLPLAALILGRDIGLIAGTAWYRYKSLPLPKTTARYFDLSLPSAEVHPPFISKLNTLLQLVLMSLSLAAPVFGYIDHAALEALRWIVGGTTVWSGAVYAFDKNVIKVLPQRRDAREE
ncbi:CDP-alcohol phosphatidyltransferase-domain-containing protein [Powellomyces hirtus]|nr:CDP-alcohol phosphatidyltransferase-domain-containing protein [Powellomyces hirtus]